VARIVAVTDAVKSLAEVEARFGLRLFMKLALRSQPQDSLSRVFSLYTLAQEWQAALQVLKQLAGFIAESQLG
jgi:hypothetical protein